VFIAELDLPPRFHPVLDLIEEFSEGELPWANCWSVSFGVLTFKMAHGLLL
jgi:hypothetical protein